MSINLHILFSLRNDAEGLTALHQNKNVLSYAVLPFIYAEMYQKERPSERENTHKKNNNNNNAEKSPNNNGTKFAIWDLLELNE